MRGTQQKDKASKHKYAKGFTLIEVMVALVIVSLALPALLFRFQLMLDQTSRIEEKNYALWLAQNKYKELALTTIISQQLVKVKESDKETFAGLPFVWSIEMFETEVPKVFRVEIKVGRSKDNWLANLEGYISG